MGKDSTKALEIVGISKKIQKPLVDKHHGKWLKEMGDGVLVQFYTALDAVNCAVEIQKSARAELDVKLRIGIHLGDVTVEADDVLGDGVNVASRLESIADHGGIYVSESIEKAIKGQSSVQTRYLGELRLKNVAYAVRTYAIQGVGLPIPEINKKKQLSGHFFAELKRRGVLRAVFAYIFLAMIIMLLIPLIKTVFELPLWITPVANTILIIGFPIALFLAWSYERSPKGFVKTTSVTSWSNPYSTAKRKPLTSNLVIGILLVITLLVFGYSNFLLNTPVNTDREVKRFHIIFPDEAPLSLLGESSAQWSYSSMTLSPDGRMLVYVGWRNGRSQLMLRYIDKTEVIPIEGTEGAYGPFFSPDGKWIAFSTNTILRKVKIPDGSPVNIIPVTIQSRAVWTNNDDIIFSNDTAIFRVSSRGGIPELVAGRDTDRIMDVVGGYTTGIDITPDQQHILFSDLAGEIYSLHIPSGKTDLIYPMGGGSPKFIPSGHLIFTRNNAVFAVPFDVKNMKPVGQESQIINGIRSERSGPQLTYANDGTAIHVPGYYYQYSTFTWIDKNGNKFPVDLEPDNYGSFELSPDGNLLAMCMLPARDNIKVYDFRSGKISVVKVDGVERLYSPVWGADNKTIMFAGFKDNSWNYFTKEINKVDEAEQLIIENLAEWPSSWTDRWPYSWSESGEFVSGYYGIFKFSKELNRLDLAGYVENGDHMTISPDDNYVVYGSLESGLGEIYVQPFPATGEKWQISTDGGTDPVWTKDGNGIFYHNDLRIYYVKINSFAPFDHDPPEVFYSGPFINAVSRSIGVGKNEDRILILEQVRGSQLSTEAVVTLNWFEEVKKLAPVQ